LNAVSAGAGRLPHSAEEISRMAPVTDRTDGAASGVISYYQLGAAIALALDLSLRSRSGGKTTLDDFMRAMWRTHGRPGGVRPGFVDRPYTLADVETALAGVSGDQAFARDFIARHIQGREIADYARLLAPAGFGVRQAPRGRVEVVTVESTRGSLTASERAFRESWLGPQ
jgi:predicted metalloprotease with PDZ domain